MAVRAGLDHLRSARLVAGRGGALFDTILQVDESEELEGLTIELSPRYFTRDVTRVNIVTGTAMAVNR